MFEVIRCTLVRGAVIIVVGMSCVTTNEALAQRSVRQLVVDAGAIIRQIEDAKRLTSCIKIDYRDQLIGGGNFWLEKVEVSIHARDPQLLNLMSVLRHLIVDIEAMPPCVPPASKDAKTDTLFSDDPSSPPVLLGSNAGEFVTDAKDGIFIGTSTGREARASDYATVVGHVAGYSLKTSPNTVLLGRATAQWLENSPSAVAIGSSAARKARNADHTIFVGSSAGYGAQNVDFSLLLGYAAGRWIKNNNYSLISGYAAGEYADYSHHSVMTGAFAGYEAAQSPRSIMIGRDAGMFADNAPAAIFIGLAAGKSARGAVNPVFIGTDAGKAATNTTDVVLIGTMADAEPGIENAVGIGKGANPTQSNTWHIPAEMKVGVGTPAPTAQLHTTGHVRFAAIQNGVLVTDHDGNVSASPLLREALQAIDSLSARVAELEAERRRYGTQELERRSGER